jgi:nitrate reductase NapE component
MGGMSKNRRESSIVPLNFNKYKQKRSASEKRMEMATLLLIAVRHFCFVSYWLTASFHGFFITLSQ